MKYAYVVSLVAVASGCSDQVCNAILPPLQLSPSPVAIRLGGRQVVEARRATCGDQRTVPVTLVWTVVDTTIAIVNQSSGELTARSVGQTVLRGIVMQSNETAIDTVRVLP